MAPIRRKHPASQFLAQTGTDNNLSLAPSQRSAREENPDRQHTLIEIAEHVRLTTGADGAAIALEESGAVVCRARAGECAPTVGAFLNQESGLSGLCLRSGKLVRCDDAHSDERVDPSVAQVLQIRSVLAVPVTRDWQVIGLVEVLSRTPNAFGSRDEATLQAVTTEVLRAWNDGLAETVDAMPEPAAQDASTPRNGTADTLRDLLAFNASLAEPVPAVPVAEQATSTEPRSEADFIAEADREPSAETVAAGAEEPAPKPAPLLRGFDEAQAEAASSSNPRAVLAGVAGLALLGVLALLGGIGLGAWRSSIHKTPKQPAVVQARVEPSEVEKLRLIADQGDATAQYDLAMRYLKGDGVERSDENATEWLIKSAHLGNSNAQLQLGVAYELGRGVPQDLVMAYACYVMAGANGNAGSESAQRALIPNLSQRQIGEVRVLIGDMYQSGRGTSPDNVQAYVWFSLAEAAGNKEGQRARRLLTSKMNKAQITAADRRASEWLMRHTPAPH